jgi:superfamily II DNA or RNA helicase
MGKQPLSVTHPEIAAQWHPAKNGDLTSDDVVGGAHKKIWWKCGIGEDHEWEASPGNRTRLGHSCPFCAGQKASKTNSLATLFPDIAAQWHPTKNGDVTPKDIVPGSNKKFWWKCSVAGDHEWRVSVANRTHPGRGCPFCRGQRVSVTNSLATSFPEIAAQWHPSMNGDLTAHDVVAGAGRKAWWKCPAGPDHEWESGIGTRTGQRGGCPFCKGQYLSVTNSLATLFPDIAAQWHQTKNGDVTPNDVVAGSNKKFWWQCAVADDHEWESQTNSRTRNNAGCPFCAGQKASKTNSLAILFPEIATEWHQSKNGEVTPASVTSGSNKKAWWQCRYDLNHEWEATTAARTKLGSGCPFCAGQRVTKNNSLATLFPEIAAEWHQSKNGDVTPADVIAGSNKKFWWKCPEAEDHEWEVTASNRTHSGCGCPFCAGRRVSVSNSLSTMFPEIAAEWHQSKNGDVTPRDVVARSGKKVWWQCQSEGSHEWRSTISNRTAGGKGCPYCAWGWTVDKIRLFVSSMREHLNTLSPAELYVLFQQSGMLSTQGKGKGFVKALVTGQFPTDELDKFIDGEQSQVDTFLDDADVSLESLEGPTPEDNDDDLSEAVVTDIDPDAVEPELPVVQTKDALAVLDSSAITSADAEAVEFLTASATVKLWNDAFRNEGGAVAEAEAFSGGEYAMQVRSAFLDEYRAAKSLDIPAGYEFMVKGVRTMPNLMQRRVAVRVRDHRRIGNWSGTGAGKTLSAVLASRVIEAQRTIICCPNAVIDGWRKAILEIYPQSQVATKTFEPAFDATCEWPQYLILNYEAFQQADSPSKVAGLIAESALDFVVIDEIHYSKQRKADDMSRRRQMVQALIQGATELKPDIAVLGMSATPVINNLQEGRSLVELVTGVEHEELATRTTVANCMRMHQQLVRLGIRWMPEYDLVDEEVVVEVDCADALDDIRQLQKVKGTPLALEQILTRKRLRCILENVQAKTLIYTHYVQGIDHLLRQALEDADWKTGFYTGDDKTGLHGFLHGDIDVLIGSSSIGTGVDGLQNVCNRLIINVLPWTAAEYDQLKGRIYRQGQFSDRIKIIVPVTYAEVNGERWSWCDSKRNRLKFKRSVADAAVDGVVPEGHLRSPGQAYQDVIKWLERLDAGQVEQIARRPITVPLPSDDVDAMKKRKASYGDFSRMNNTWNRRDSAKTHEALSSNPEEWEQYHTLYREARASWAAVPYEEMIRWLREREGLVVGDFGCGEAQLAEAVADRHTVYSFDHVAINDNVTACDLASVPLDDESIDTAVFSLSLMGENFTDYLREAHRTLKIDGHLHIFESTSRFTDRDRFVQDLKHLGFDQFAVEDRWKFSYIRALKAKAMSEAKVALSF